MGSKQQDPTKKWSSEQIIALIEAYKEELCLYAINTRNYHNKHMRNEALKRVGDTVRIFRPNTLDKECSTKFHSLRTQYNIEHSKVKGSMKSGTGTEDIYKPSLWYYEHLSFLESFFTPRKSRNSVEPSLGAEAHTVLDFVSSQMIASEGFSEDGRLNVLFEEDVGEIENTVPDTPAMDVQLTPQPFSESPSSSLSMNGSTPTSLASTSSNFHPSPSPSPANIRPSPSQSPANIRPSSFLNAVNIRPSTSASPAHSVSSSACGSRPQKRKSNSNGDYSGAIAALAESIRQPIVLANPPPSNTFTAMSQSADHGVNGFLIFLSSSIQRIENEELRLDLMRTLMETAVNARTADIERSRRS